MWNCAARFLDIWLAVKDLNGKNNQSESNAGIPDSQQLTINFRIFNDYYWITYF